MFKSTMYAAAVIAASLALAACQQQPNPASEAPAMQSAPEAQPAAPAPKPTASSAMTAEPAAPAPAAAQQSATPTAVTKPSPPAATKPTAMAPKSSAPASAAATSTPAKPEASAAMSTRTATSSAQPEAMSTTLSTFSTTKCMACHAIDHDKVGPAWKTVVEKYGDEATLAKDFEAGFKERRVANSIAKWKSKEGLMTPQFDHLIKGHEKEAAHALFETVKNGKFGSY